MDNIKQRIAIARALGWKHLPKDPEMIQYTAELPNGKWGLIPDYPNDLNAMRIAEMTIPSELYAEYLDQLDIACGGELSLSMMLEGPDYGFIMITAPADKRAESFLKIFNLWIEND